MGVDVTPFTCIDVLDVIQSIKTNIRHVPHRKLPVSHHMLESVIRCLYLDPEGPSISFAVIIMYFLFLRQSNVCPRNKSSYDPTRHLTRADVLLRSDAIIVGIKWSKSR